MLVQSSVPAETMDGRGQSQEPGSPSKPPTWVAGTQIIKPSPVAIAGPRKLQAFSSNSHRMKH